MKSPRQTIALLCTFAWAALPGARGQEKPQSNPPASPAATAQQSDAQARIVVVTNLVLVPVTVKDAAGRLVADLQKDDFRVFEDDVEQKVDTFSNDPFPLSIVVLIDNELKKSTSQHVEASLPAIVGGLSDKDEVFVCRFDANFHPGKGFTSGPDRLLTELKRTGLSNEPAAGPSGGPFSGPSINGQPAPGASQKQPSGQILLGRRSKALDDAMYEAADLLKSRGRDRRKIVLLISDGDNVKKNKYSFEDAARKLLEGDISVFSIGVGDALLNRKFSPLPRYANATGGDVFYAARREALEETYARVTEEARNQYTLAYVSHGTDRTLDYHSVEVRVKRPGLSIRARDGYYLGVPK